MTLDIARFDKAEIDPGSVVGGVGGDSPLTGNGSDDVFALSAGTGLKLGIPPTILTGNGTDDVFAVSAGTGQKLSLSGGSPAASLAASVMQTPFTFGPNGSSAPDGLYTKTAGGTQHVGDGSTTLLSAVYTSLALAQVVYPFVTTLTQTVDYAALQLAINTVAAQTAPTGGTLHVPRGTYRMGDPNTSQLVIPYEGANVPFSLQGENGRGSDPSSGAVSNIVWSSTVDISPQIPHLTFAIDCRSDRGTLKGLSFRGPSKFTFNSGRLPCALAGLRAGSSSLIENCSFNQFSTAVGLGGSLAIYGGGAADRGFDHSSIRGLYVNGCGYGIELLQGSNTAGDLHWYDLEIHSNCAAIAVAASASSGFVGSNITGAGLYGGIGMYLYDDQTNGGAQILGNTFENVSMELSYNAAVYCQKLSNPGGGIFAKNKMCYFFQGPHSNPATPGWASPNAFTVTAAPAGATGNQITISDNNGIEWAPGMTVTVNANVPAGATITAINGHTTRADIMANWPYNNPTFTLSANLTADPTGGTVRLLQPKLGHIVGFTIHDNVAPTFAAGYPPYPLYYTPAGGQINDNACWDVNQTLIAALTNPMTSGPTYGTTWGQPGSSCFFGSGQMSGGVGCTAGDLLMYDATGSKLVLCDATRPPVGAAILTTPATTPGSNVDFYITASNPNPATIRNKSGSTIAGGDLLTVDAAHAGGARTATGPNDGFVIGYNDASTIASGASGTIAQLKC